MIKMSFVALSGWFALFAFAGMLGTCICFYTYQCYFARRTKTKCDDYVFSVMHKAHKIFVWVAVAAISVHVILAVMV